MIEVTPRARKELHGMLLEALAPRANGALRGLGFRLVALPEDPSALALRLDAPGRGDLVVEHEGCSVLIVDSQASLLLEGLTLDVVETEEGPSLGLRPTY